MGTPDAGPVRVELKVEGIPSDLRGFPQWVAWRVAPPKKPGDKFGKVPIDPHTGGNASTTRLRTWGTFADAVARMKSDGLPGVGFVFTGSGFAGIDIDKCRNADTGEIHAEAKAIVESLWSYTEVSPSGNGLHVIVRGKLPGKGRKRGRIEVYDAGRFFTITGVRVPERPAEIFERQEALTELYNGLQTRSAKTGQLQRVEPPALDDAELIRRASEAKNGAKFRALWEGRFDAYPSQSEAELALCSILSFYTAGDANRIDALIRKSGLFRPKWDEPRGNSTYGCDTIQKALSTAVPSTTPKPAEFPSGRNPPLTDTGNSERFRAQFGEDFRYSHEWKMWLPWHRGHWAPDRVGAAMACSKKVVRSIYAEAAACGNDRERVVIDNWAKASEKAERRRALVELARTEGSIPITIDQLDRHPHLFNCANGTLDLNTLELREHRRGDYLTKHCPTKFVPDAKCSRWLEFMERIMPDDDERAYLQRHAGYCLTGDTSEQVLLIGIGEGANGKSIFTRTLQSVFSPAYAIQIASDLLLHKENRGHPTELADLYGVRLAIGIETPHGRSLDEPLVKQLTGSDRIRARRMREDFWEFEPTHKLLLVTNHMPSISVADYAMVRRLHILRFAVTIPEKERDKKLLAKLEAEREGILAWSVAGLRAWKDRGLDPPQSVLYLPPTTARVKQPVEVFVDERTVHTPGVRTKASELYQAFLAWCSATEHTPTTQREFGAYLGHKGYGSKKTGGVVVYLNLALLATPQAPKGPLGTIGDHSPVDTSPSAHEEVNGDEGPYGPQRSPNGMNPGACGHQGDSPVRGGEAAGTEGSRG